ncbi:hypothetical protein LINPERHAP2_LOCUS18756 [Linum perenne]
MSLPREVVDVSITSPGIGGGSRNMPIDLNEMLVPSAGITYQFLQFRYFQFIRNIFIHVFIIHS